MKQKRKIAGLCRSLRNTFEEVFVAPSINFVELADRAIFTHLSPGGGKKPEKQKD